MCFVLIDCDPIFFNTGKCLLDAHQLPQWNANKYVYCRKRMDLTHCNSIPRLVFLSQIVYKTCAHHNRHIGSLGSEIFGGFLDARMQFLHRLFSLRHWEAEKHSWLQQSANELWFPRSQTSKKGPT